ncbi:MAG: hypothetical protein AAGK78_16510 [Planctomycetota bacterium]
MGDRDEERRRRNAGESAPRAFNSLIGEHRLTQRRRLSAEIQRFNQPINTEQLMAFCVSHRRRYNARIGRKFEAVMRTTPQGDGVGEKTRDVFDAWGQPSVKRHRDAQISRFRMQPGDQRRGCGSQHRRWRHADIGRSFAKPSVNSVFQAKRCRAGCAQTDLVPGNASKNKRRRRPFIHSAPEVSCAERGGAVGQACSPGDGASELGRRARDLVRVARKRVVKRVHVVQKTLNGPAVAQNVMTA